MGAILLQFFISDLWKTDASLDILLFYIQSKEIGNKKYYEETRELEEWQS